MTQIDADGEKGSARVPRAISGVSPETLWGETPNTTREDAYAPQTPRQRHWARESIADVRSSICVHLRHLRMLRLNPR